MKKTKSEPEPPPPQRGCLTKTEVEAGISKANSAAHNSFMMEMLGGAPPNVATGEPYKPQHHRHDTFGDEPCICCQINARHPKPKVRIDAEGRFYRPSVLEMAQAEMTIRSSLDSYLKQLEAEFKASQQQQQQPQKDKD